MNPKGKKFIVLIIVLSLVIFSGNSMAEEQKYGEDERNPESLRKKIKISFKITGGLGYLLNGAGDLNRAREGLEAILSDWGKQDNYSSTFDWKRLSMLSDWKADLIINITPKIGIGIGSGFITASNKGKYSLSSSYSWSWEDWTDTGEDKSNVDEDYKITAIPLNLDVYFFQPMGKSNKYNFFGYAGFGYYFGKLTHVEKVDGSYNYDSFISGSLNYQGESEYSTTRNEEMKNNSFGFHGGLGLEMKMSSVISFGVELFGRYVNFKNWEGDASTSWESKYKYWSSWSGWEEGTNSSKEEDVYGQLWTFDIHNEISNKYHTYMMFMETKPSDGTFYKNTKKASINLNTFGLSFSIKFHF
ncbi:MAG: hypothetical protein ISS41_07265 [Candidatus Aminicenantes bacterium]|nr:hypothetical protein [Candidatus Aminicenantes bacterium]MBL7083412.1 hypothetical protein [Candidatus Aminicenantes bacterium]